MANPKRIRLRHRRIVWERDRGTCQYCGYPARDIDHIVPHSWRPDDSLENLALACGRCNQLAQNLMFKDFAEKREWLLAIRRPEMARDYIDGWEYRVGPVEKSLEVFLEDHAPIDHWGVVLAKALAARIDENPTDNEMVILSRELRQVLTTVMATAEPLTETDVDRFLAEIHAEGFGH